MSQCHGFATISATMPVALVSFRCREPGPTDIQIENAMAAEGGSFDFIPDCVAATHDINAYLRLLKRDATQVHVGAPPAWLSVQVSSSDIELIRMNEVDTAFGRMVPGDVTYRFVTDMSMLAEAA